MEEETEDGEQEGDQETVEKDLERLQLVDESNKPDGVISEETMEDNKAPEDGRVIISQSFISLSLFRRMAGCQERQTEV